MIDLHAILGPEFVEAIERLVDERVRVALDERGGADNGTPWLSVKDGAAYLRISDRQLQRAITKGKLPSTTIGRRRLLYRDDLDRFARAAGEE